ncbi:MAG: hypothetical protein JO273_09120 [Methylobacteriaceae bacterium]|nr:hypothetical protein [Methylobacteriaceae bacterium]
MFTPIAGALAFNKEIPMRKLATVSSLLGAMLLAVLSGAPAQAQQPVSFVSFSGNDSNPCNLAMPCHTFAGAFAKTAVAGVIYCLDQSNFSDGTTFTITHSITIDCDAVKGNVSAAFDTTAIMIDGGVSDDVVLRGLDIAATGGTNVQGIYFFRGGTLHVQNCTIHGFGWGIFFQNSQGPAMVLEVSDTALMYNGSSSLEGGIAVQPQVSPSISKAILNRVQVENNFFGIKADGTQAGGVINMTVRDTVSSGNASNGIVGTTNAGGAAIVMLVERSASSHNAAGFGVIADGAKTTIRLSNSAVSGNINGIGVSNGGVLASYGNNDVSGNSVDGNPTTMISPK